MAIGLVVGTVPTPNMFMTLTSLVVHRNASARVSKMMCAARQGTNTLHLMNNGFVGMHNALIDIRFCILVVVVGAVAACWRTVVVVVVVVVIIGTTVVVVLVAVVGGATVVVVSVLVAIVGRVVVVFAAVVGGTTVVASVVVAALGMTGSLLSLVTEAC